MRYCLQVIYLIRIFILATELPIVALGLTCYMNSYSARSGVRLRNRRAFASLILDTDVGHVDRERLAIGR